MASLLFFLQLFLRVQEISRTELSGEEIVTDHRNIYKNAVKK